jgi:membrane-associated phospholipid phosphatase
VSKAQIRPARRKSPESFSLRRRLAAHWRLKLVSVLGFAVIFFTGYFLLLKYPVFAVTEMPLTVLDRLVPLQPSTLMLYVSLWIYVPLVPGLMTETWEIRDFYRTAGLICLIGFTVFFFWPTAVPSSALSWAGHPAFARLKAADDTGNACPSLHVAFAVFCAGLLQRQLRNMPGSSILRFVNWLWCAAIAYSTLATRQHVAVDVLAGTALGAAGIGFHCWREARTREAAAAVRRSRSPSVGPASVLR